MVTLRPEWSSYLRVSDKDKQKPELSFAMQRRSIHERLISPSGMPLGREYRDTLTGNNPNRSDYQQMLADAEAGHYSHLGLYRADRFGRDVVEGLQAARTLIHLGVKIRVASNASLEPETPAGFLMFLMLMGVAQHEVEVMRQRINDGMAAKLRAGGWPYKAPEGYVNKRTGAKGGKDVRWVEQDPEIAPVLREAWNLLLTGHYTLDEICEELAAQGHLRSGGRPWAWNDQQTGGRKTAKNRLHRIFNNPFYAGWAVSEKHGVAVGESKGEWEPIVTVREFERGKELLRRRGLQKSRFRRHQYLLRKILWTAVGGSRYRMYGTTPSGRSRSYPYYITHAKPNGKKVRIPCATVDEQIPRWLHGIGVKNELLPAIREEYESQLQAVSLSDRDKRIAQLNHRLSQLKKEGVRLGRLHMKGKIDEADYDTLRDEWLQDKSLIKVKISDLKSAEVKHLDDLDLALTVLARAPQLYERLDVKKRASLLRILAKRIIVSPDGEIFDHELNSPFEYLASLVDKIESADKKPNGRGSDHVLLAPPHFGPYWWGFLFAYSKQHVMSPAILT